MSERVSMRDYADAVAALLPIASASTSGGRVAAQVLLSAYNGMEFQLDVAEMQLLDRKNFELAMTVIRGRYELNTEPHDVIHDGSKHFERLWDHWPALNVKARGKS